MHRMNPLFVAFVIAFTAPFTFAQPAQSTSIVEPSPVRAVEHHDVNKKKANLAIKGYDPVAYFKEGGNKATKGKKSISTNYKSVTYYFSSESNKELFLKNPARYEPAYGGWCAWAMSNGSKTEVNPKTYIVKDGRLYLFYNGVWGNTKKDWEKGDHAQLSSSADSEWKDISGESPRIAQDAMQAP